MLVEASKMYRILNRLFWFCPLEDWLFVSTVNWSATVALGNFNEYIGFSYRCSQSAFPNHSIEQSTFRGTKTTSDSDLLVAWSVLMGYTAPRYSYGSIDRFWTKISLPIDGSHKPCYRRHNLVLEVASLPRVFSGTSSWTLAKWSLIPFNLRWRRLIQWCPMLWVSLLWDDVSEYPTIFKWLNDVCWSTRGSWSTPDRDMTERGMQSTLYRTH